jgi:hypothetical protein
MQIDIALSKADLGRDRATVQAFEESVPLLFGKREAPDMAIGGHAHAEGGTMAGVMPTRNQS